MNVLVVNQQESVLTPLNIEIIKTLRGTFTSDEIISTFTNFFFARMIIDITALQDNEDIVTYQKLSIGLPIDKIILLIPANSKVANNFFLSKLISMGYYNFTTNGDGILYLLNTPNTYKEVAHLHQQEMVQQPQMMEQAQPANDMSNQNQEMYPQPVEPAFTGIRILGIADVTDGAGASSLIYMLKKELEESYNMSVMALEIDKREFAFFRENDMSSSDKNTIATDLLKAKDYNYILVDLNDYEENICDETLYLLEPSVIKLNKLMLRDRTIFSKLKDKKVIINKSTLSEADVKEFAQEAGIDIFYVLPPLNDRERSIEIRNLLTYLGMVR